MLSPAATVTEAGTERSLLLELANVTTEPPLRASALQLDTHLAGAPRSRGSRARAERLDGHGASAPTAATTTAAAAAMGAR